MTCKFSYSVDLLNDYGFPCKTYLKIYVIVKLFELKVCIRMCKCVYVLSSLCCS